MTKFKTFLKDYSNSLVAITTLILAAFTFIHVMATNKMVSETKKLTELNIKQFKIKSYPSFQIFHKKVQCSPTSILDEFQIINQGEITAHEVFFLVVYVFQEGETFHFHPQLSAYYRTNPNDVKVTTANTKRKFYPKSSMSAFSKLNQSEKLNMELLKFQLVFIKFKVPYDDNYSYEFSGYIFRKNLENNVSESAHWQQLSIKHELSLSKTYKAISSQDGEIVQQFFSGL